TSGDTRLDRQKSLRAQACARNAITSFQSAIAREKKSANTRKRKRKIARLINTKIFFSTAQVDFPRLPRKVPDSPPRMRIWFFCCSESPIGDFGVVRREQGTRGHVLLALLLVFGAITIIGCTRSSLNSASPWTTKCQVSAQTSSGSIAAGGGTAEVDVTAEPECAWKATTDASWVAELAPASGQGPAKVEVRASPNA